MDQGKSTGQDIPAWGNRKGSVQGGDGERERESPFAVLDAAAAEKFKGIAT